MLQDVLPLRGVQDDGPQTVLPLAEPPRRPRAQEPIEFNPSVGEDPQVPGVRRGAEWRRRKSGGVARARPWASIETAWSHQDVRVGRGAEYDCDRRMLADLRAQTWEIEDLNRRSFDMPIWIEARELIDPATGEQLRLWDSDAPLRPRTMHTLQVLVCWLWHAFVEGTGGIHEKQDVLADKLRVSVRTLQRLIRVAERRGLIYVLPLRVVDAATGKVLQRAHVYRLGPAICGLAAVAAFEHDHVTAPESDRQLRLRWKGSRLGVALREAVRNASYAHEGAAYAQRELTRARYQERLRDVPARRRKRTKQSRRSAIRRARASTPRRPARATTTNCHTTPPPPTGWDSTGAWRRPAGVPPVPPSEPDRDSSGARDASTDRESTRQSPMARSCEREDRESSRPRAASTDREPDRESSRPRAAPTDRERFEAAVAAWFGGPALVACPRCHVRKSRGTTRSSCPACDGRGLVPENSVRACGGCSGVEYRKKHCSRCSGSGREPVQKDTNPSTSACPNGQDKKNRIDSSAAATNTVGAALSPPSVRATPVH